MNLTTIFLPIRAIMGRQTIIVSSKTKKKKIEGWKEKKKKEL